jgi:hypothetical protein
MLLPTIKPVYSGSYATGYLKIKEKCKVQHINCKRQYKVRVKLTLCSIIHHSTQTYGDIEVEAHVFLIWAGV